jgi:histidinol dehydrogenase
VTDYLKVISVQQLTSAALQRLAPAITTLARAEGLEAHARSVEVRQAKAPAQQRRKVGQTLSSVNRVVS